MNLFVTDVSPQLAATHLDDKRLSSALREACQMMSLAVKVHDENFDEFTHCGEGMVNRGRAHLNHPVSIWVRANISNWSWTWNYAEAVAQEWIYRYGTHHGAIPRVRYLRQFVHCLPAGDLLPFQNSARNEGLGLDFSDYPVPLSYRMYLCARWETDKRAVTFRNRGAPPWSQLTQ